MFLVGDQTQLFSESIIFCKCLNSRVNIFQGPKKNKGTDFDKCNFIAYLRAANAFM